MWLECAEAENLKEGVEVREKGSKSSWTQLHFRVRWDTSHGNWTLLKHLPGYFETYQWNGFVDSSLAMTKDIKKNKFQIESNISTVL